jgi:hypothetical protein
MFAFQNTFVFLALILINKSDHGSSNQNPLRILQCALDCVTSNNGITRHTTNSTPIRAD